MCYYTGRHNIPKGNLKVKEVTDKMREANGRKHKAHTCPYRWLAFVLAMALCLGSSSLQVLAAEEAGAYTGYAESNSSEAGTGSRTDGNDQTENGEQPADGEEPGTDEQPADGDEPEAGRNPSAGDGAGTGEKPDGSNQGDGEEPGDGEQPADGDEPEAGGQPAEEDHPGDGPENGGSSDLPEHETGNDEDEDDEDEEQISDNTLESVSDNALDTVSENDLDSVSENDLDEEWEALVKEAEEAFAKLLDDKALMALIYHTDSYQVRSEAKEDSAPVAVLQSGHTVYLRGVRITQENIWYRVQFWMDGGEQTGYVQSYYLAYSDEDWLAWEEEYISPLWKLEHELGRSAYGMRTYAVMERSVDYSDISAFPSSYQGALRKLKDAHPNWTFVPMNTGLDFQTVVRNQMGDKSLIQNTSSNVSKGWVGSKYSGSWYYATEAGVSHYLNPCNFLAEEYMFQFEQLTFNSSYHNVSAVQAFLNSTFMKGAIPDDSGGRTYAEAFYEIGKNRKLSPIHLASRVYQEQGKGTSPLISGTYSGYEGYYNYFNVGASGTSDAEVIRNGLAYAKSKNWNTRYKSLEGGAATIGNNYVLKGQDTPYLQKFNVDGSYHSLYTHQYMQNIQAPASESQTTRKMYSGAGSLNSAFVFKIPVYKNMPGGTELTLNKTSHTMNKGDTLQLSAALDGIAVAEDDVTWKSDDPSVATVQGGLVSALKAGETTITATYDGCVTSCHITVENPLQGISLQYDGQAVSVENPVVLRREDTVTEDTAGFTDREIKENVSEAVLQAVFEPEDATGDRTIVWSTSNSKTATVKADPEDSTRAIVTAKAAGEVTITAKASKAGNLTAACKVEVIAPVYSLKIRNLNAKEIDTDEQTTLYAGQNVNLTAEYEPKNTTSDTQITWSSSDERVAVVNNGKVTALSEGEAEITASMTGRDKVYSAVHRIVVKECSVVFMKQDGTTRVKVLNMAYGERVPKEEFPEAQDVDGSLFIGWYTGRNGTGSLFDETTAVYQELITVYPHYEEQGKGFYVVPVGDQTYTGSAIKPVIQVYDGASYEDGDTELVPLVLNQDYSVSYKNNKNVNAEGSKAVPTITVKGKGNYAGTQYVYFNIVPKALTDRDITAENITAAYSGRTIKSAPQILRDGKKLRANTDYTVTYPQTGTGAYQQTGTYPIVIKGKGGYTGTITVYETITQSVLLSKASVTKIPNQTYRNELVDKEAGIGIMPAGLTVKYKNTILEESKDGGRTGDYTVTYRNNMEIGTATATITAVEGSGFAGSKSVTYKIVGTSLTKAKVTGIEAREYTGSEEDVKQSGYALTLNGQELVEDVDYVVSYSNLSKVGTAKIVFQGINEYTGKITKSYKITAHYISSDEAGNDPQISMAYYLQGEDASRAVEIDSLEEISAPYVKSGSKPVVILYFRGAELTPGKDYTIKYANHNAVTTDDMTEKKLPKITITGKGNFKGSFSGTWKITDGQMADGNGKLVMTAKDVVYKNKKGAYKTSAVITDVSGSKLAAGRDYEKTLLCTYVDETAVTGADGSMIVRSAGEEAETSDIVPAGTRMRLTAFGKGAYAGENGSGASISVIYRVVASNISGAKVKTVSKSYQNGRAVTLKPEELTVTFKGVSEPLVYGEDYVIDAGTYVSNSKKGKASVIIRGIGNYGGEKKITYTIGARQILWWRNN